MGEIQVTGELGRAGAGRAGRETRGPAATPFTVSCGQFNNVFTSEIYKIYCKYIKKCLVRMSISQEVDVMDGRMVEGRVDGECVARPRSPTEQRQQDEGGGARGGGPGAGHVVLLSCRLGGGRGTDSRLAGGELETVSGASSAAAAARYPPQHRARKPGLTRHSEIHCRENQSNLQL